MNHKIVLGVIASAIGLFAIVVVVALLSNELKARTELVPVGKIVVLQTSALNGTVKHLLHVKHLKQKKELEKEIFADIHEAKVLTASLSKEMRSRFPEIELKNLMLDKVARRLDFTIDIDESVSLRAEAQRLHEECERVSKGRESLLSLLLRKNIISERELMP